MIKACSGQSDPPDCEAPPPAPGSVGKCPAASAVGSDFAWPARFSAPAAFAFGSGGGRGDGGGALGVFGGGGGGRGDGRGDGSALSPPAAGNDRAPVGALGEGGGLRLLNGGGGGGLGDGRGDTGGRSNAGSRGTIWTVFLLPGDEARDGELKSSSEGSLGITTGVFTCAAGGSSEVIISSAAFAAAENGESGCGSSS